MKRAIWVSGRCSQTTRLILIGTVTREEATWESFSEDEPVPKKKPAVNVAKGKGAKPGQGNIMSFFGKKQ